MQIEQIGLGQSDDTLPSLTPLTYRSRRKMDELLKAVTRREVDIVLAWSVDRLGRSLQAC